MREWIPIPGSVKARLVEAAVHQFELAGYEEVNVTELAAKASVTTGALYHHFDSKLGLYLVVREEMERRVVDRMAGAAAAVGGEGRAAARAALLVAFDAAVRFGVCRILAESVPVTRVDPIEATLRPLLPDAARTGGAMLAAAWRAALLAVADGTPSSTARESLEYVLG
ncbi:TetR/AcrR family transcriptional regulator [Actinophytocola gossypii]|uniref:TetR/AcrR family transcriptional regulator n=1 Tax=Actinophytocola gossypii TaxID=2812003 RepID=A0ABT2JHI6_9PSEU|nr:helix-turn-helix domain-containing protein [Actinophytocola gossypii]MCT2587348.1 TetR/AcrR family transcriptional regulator [Actinophytocola gossypii]